MNNKPITDSSKVKLAPAGSGVLPVLGDGTEGLVKIPVAVTVKPVLAMIAAHLKGQHKVFEQNALAIARELELNNEVELSLWVKAQYGLVRTFEVTD